MQAAEYSQLRVLMIHLAASHADAEDTVCCVLQATLTQRAVELLALPQDGHPRMLLDLGCGSGLSGEELSDLVSWPAWASPACVDG